MERKADKGIRQTGKEQKHVAVYCYEQRLLSHIRSVKLVRDIGKGNQRRLTEWVS